MSDNQDPNCNNPESHWLHICQLRHAEKPAAELQRLRRNPRYRCLNCNASADYAKNLCNPMPLGNEFKS